MKTLAIPAILLVTTGLTAQKDIVETALATGKFKTLATALEKAGLVDALRGKGPFTVFAPTDEAFAKLPEGTVAGLLEPENKARLTAILTYHVLPARVSAAQAVQAGRAKTLQGATIRVSLDAGRLRINEANVDANDVRASNGIIHVIDSVLLPPAASQPEQKERKLTRPEALRKVIEDAIDSGVPLFNHGQPAACAAIYRIAAFAVLQLGRDQLRDGSRRALTSALDAVERSSSASDNAWTLRRALDATLLDLMQRTRNVTSAASRKTMKTKDLFTFDDARDAGWRSINDDVMGGVSKGRMIFDASTRSARFVGELSRKNNGGFSTIRSKSSNLGLADYDGLVVRVRGDGRTYRLQALGGDSRWEMRIYQFEFETTKDEWQEIRVPFASMQRTFRGRRLGGRIDGAQVRSIGFSIADKNESPFALEIDWIKAYRNAASGSAAAGGRP